MKYETVTARKLNFVIASLIGYQDDLMNEVNRMSSFHDHLCKC